MKPFTQAALMERIRAHGIHSIILDTDAYNEVDDQFCLAYCMRTPEHIRLLSVNAAPFLNSRSRSAQDGMELSYQEIFKVMKLVDPQADIPVYRGSCSFLPDRNTPVQSDAAQNIIRTVMDSEEPVLIVAIGAITNVASALLLCPELAQRTGVIWLGGHSFQSRNTREFNLRQDIAAAQVVFDSGIPMVQVPCDGVCSQFVTTVPELEYYLGGKNGLCDYLVDNVRQECKSYACSRIIWDVTAAAVLIRPDACQIVTVPRPYVTSDCLYAYDLARPHYGYVRSLNRDIIYGDLFRRLTGENS